MNVSGTYQRESELGKASDAEGTDAGGWRVVILSVQALGIFLFLDLALRLFGFPRVLRLLTAGRSRSDPRRPAEHGLRQARRTLRAVRNATRFYYRQRKDCLPKALTTFHLLRRSKVPAELCYGVRKYPFAAHSWVEAYGTVLDDHPQSVSSYTVIHRIAA